MTAKSDAPQETPVRARAQEAGAGLARLPRRGAFWMGALIGLLAGVPSAALAVAALASTAGVARIAPLGELLRMAAIFAALPAALSAGGVARAGARSYFRIPAPSRLRVVAGAAAGFAPAGIGLVVLTGVAGASIPAEPVQWLWLAAGGLGAGLATGALIGVVAARPPREAR